MNPDPAGQAPGPNRSEQARLAVFWGAVASAASARAKTFTAGLEAQAREELERDGYAPTWRIPGLGTVPLALTSDRVDISDEAAYVAWVARRHPTEVETITRVRAAFDEQFRRQLARRGEPLCDDEGTIIPGLTFRQGGLPRGIQIRPEPAAKEAAAALAGAYLDAMPDPPTDLTA